MISSFVIGWVVVWRANKELLLGRRNSLRDEYKFAKSFFEDLEVKEPAMHLYVRQKGFQAIAGATHIPHTEIEYLLTFNDPVRVLNEYVVARDLLLHYPTAGRNQITFKSLYRTASRRKALLALYIAGFGLSYLVAVFPLFAWIWGKISLPLMISLMSASMPILIGTYFSARAAVKLRYAERLVKSQ